MVNLYYYFILQLFDYLIKYVREKNIVSLFYISFPFMREFNYYDLITVKLMKLIK